MSSHLVCQEIDCPYWSSDTKTSYGCQRWSMATDCHLKHMHPDLQATEYALYSDQPIDLIAVANENKAFFLEDTKYLQDLQLQQAFPNLEVRFPSRNLASEAS